MSQDAPAIPPSPPPGVHLPPPAPPRPMVFDGPQRTTARAGHLVPWAKVAHLITWAAIAVGLGMVGRSSTVTGLGTWWVGPPGHPHVILIMLLPFVPPVAMVILVLSWSRHVPWWGIVASLALGAVAVADIGYVRGYALVEGALAVCGLAVSLLSLAGRYRARQT